MIVINKNENKKMFHQKKTFKKVVRKTKLMNLKIKKN